MSPYRRFKPCHDRSVRIRNQFFAEAVPASCRIATLVAQILNRDGYAVQYAQRFSLVAKRIRCTRPRQCLLTQYGDVGVEFRLKCLYALKERLCYSHRIQIALSDPRSDLRKCLVVKRLLRHQSGLLLRLVERTRIGKSSCVLTMPDKRHFVKQR